MNQLLQIGMAQFDLGALTTETALQARPEVMRLSKGEEERTGIHEEKTKMEAHNV